MYFWSLSSDTSVTGSRVDHYSRCFPWTCKIFLCRDRAQLSRSDKNRKGCMDTTTAIYNMGVAICTAVDKAKSLSP